MQLARGYWRRPALTVERFFPDPACPEERLYRTGDRVIIREDGVVEYLGRMDDQVKVRGVRVELGEVDAALRLAPGVRQSAVVVRHGNLVAYVAPEGEAPTLRGHMSALLPEAMVPSRFVVLPVLPLTPHGKIDRAALPEPRTAGTGEPPATPREQRVARLWEEALGVPVAGRDDDFFELGGQSLVATRILARLEAESGIRLTHADLFDARTVAAFADRIAATPGDPPCPTGFRPPPLKPLGRRGGPLSFAQKAIWIISQLVPDRPVYNEPFTIRIPAPVDPHPLEAALRALVARHDILRTAFTVDDEGVPHQALRDVSPLVLRWSDLSALALPARDAEAARLAENDAVEPFDLARPPLLRARLVRFCPANSRLYITIHHLVFDAHTIYYELLPDLRAFWESRLPRPLPAVNQIDFAVWEQSWGTGTAVAEELAWWLRTLEGAVAPSLPGFPARPRLRSYRGTDLPAIIPARRVAELRLLANSQGATLHMVLLTAFAAALRRFGGPDDRVIMIVDSGRGSTALEHVAGCFANPLLVRLDLQGRPPANALLRRVRAACVDAYAHRSVPFLMLAETLAARRRPTFHQIAFVMEPEVGAGLGDWTVSQFDTQTRTSKSELSLLLEESRGEVVGRLNIDTDRFTVDHAAHLMAEYHSVLAAMAARPDG
ncbi:MAG: AMP-binding protein, partial [Verrucomicrobia bacterium]